MSLVLTLIDEVNCHLAGLRQFDIDQIVEGTKIPDKGAFMTAAFQTGNWDGKTSYFDEETCIFFQFMLDDVLSILETQCGCNLDSLEVVDERINEDLTFDDIPLIDENYFGDRLSFALREYQVNGINRAITDTKGILEYGTSAGKTIICAGISEVFQSKLKSLIITPSAGLVKQTEKQYLDLGLKAKAMTASIKTEKRAKVFEDYDHIIMTPKLLMNCAGMFESRNFVLIYDEAHVLGEEFAHFMRTELGDCPVRMGLTGTVPKDKLKRRLIECHIGGTVLDIVSTDYLMQNKFVSSASITMIETHDEEIEEISNESDQWTWDTEAAYLGTNIYRIKAIAQFIKSLPPQNTLVLCHAQLGARLGAYFGERMIIDATPQETREKWFAEFDESDSYTLCASYGTSGTGLSINRIFRLILIDVGKNEVYIRQGIGRGLRLDGEVNHCDIIDITARTKYSHRHRKDRLKIYKREKFKYVESRNYIQVSH